MPDTADSLTPVRAVGRFGLLGIVLGTIGCDHATKYVATTTLMGTPSRSYLGNLLRIGYAENTGGFLSVGASLPPATRTIVFTAMTGLILLGLAIATFRARLDHWTALGLSLFVAGGVSNWIDRLVRGTVVDFLNLGIGTMRTGIFNVADIAIMMGAGFLVYGELRKIAERRVEAPG